MIEARAATLMTDGEARFAEATAARSFTPEERQMLELGRLRASASFSTLRAAIRFPDRTFLTTMASADPRPDWLALSGSMHRPYPSRKSAPCRAAEHSSTSSPHCLRTSRTISTLRAWTQRANSSCVGFCGTTEHRPSRTENRSRPGPSGNSHPRPGCQLLSPRRSVGHRLRRRSGSVRWGRLGRRLSAWANPFVLMGIEAAPPTTIPLRVLSSSAGYTYVSVASLRRSGNTHSVFNLRGRIASHRDNRPIRPVAPERTLQVTRRWQRVSDRAPILVKWGEKDDAHREICVLSALSEYLRTIVEPTFEDFCRNPSSARHGFLACLVTSTAIDRAGRPGRPGNLTKQWRDASADFRDSRYDRA